MNNLNEQRSNRANNHKSGNPQVAIIMRDKSHSEQVIRWAEYIKKHPRSVWIKEVKPLIDSQIIMANNFYERLAKTEGGIEKIRKLRETKLIRHRLREKS
jgi:hypothetical protein